MCKILNPKFLIFVFLIFISIVIKNCENFQLKDLGETGETDGAVEEKPISVAQKYPFRKLNVKKINFDTTADDDNDDDDDTFTFLKVRRRPGRDSTKEDSEVKNEDDDDDDSEEDEDDEPSFFSRVMSFFKRDSKTSENESEKEIDDDDSKEEKENDGSGENDDTDGSGEDDNDESGEEEDDEENEIEEKPENFFVGIFEKVTGFFGSKDDKPKSEVAEDDDKNDDDDDDDDNSGEKENDENETDDDDDDEPKTISEKIKSVFPFKYFFGADKNDSGEDEDDESEEDEVKYKAFLKEDKENDDDDDDDDDNDSEEEETKPAPKKLQPIKKDPPKLPQKPKKVEKPKEKISISPDDFDSLIRHLPSFIPDYIKVQNSECRSQGQIFKRQLRGQKIWALQMMDANAKVPSGLLRGNANQLGDFDLCTRISQKIKISDKDIMKMKGKYCLANIDVTAAVDELKLPVHLMQGRNFMRSTIHDPNHFFPRYSTINWGLCLPSACTHTDAEKLLRSFIGPYNTTGIKMYVKVDEDSCFVRQGTGWVDLLKENYKIFMTSMLFLFILALTITASLNDYWGAICKNPLFASKPSDEKSGDESKEISPVFPENTLTNKLMMSFSVKKTVPALFGFSAKDNEFKFMHGLKAIGIVLLFVSLKLIPMGRFPYSNRNRLTEFFNSPLSIILRSSFLYEDLFLVISGFFASYTLLKELSEKGKIMWTKRIFGRFLRLTPPLVIVLLFYSWIWEHIGNGPQWGNIVVANADLCKENMWRNSLFIQNLFPFENMCATHTYHLAIDMQLYLMAPILMYLIYKHPKYGLAMYGILHSLSAAARFSSTIDNRLSVVIFHGMKLSQLYRTANLSFAVAIHRATPYLIGIASGITVKEFGKVTLPKGAVICGWLATIASFVWCFWAPAHLSSKDYQYEPVSSAHYAALAPLVWSLGIAWVIFACNSDNSCKLNWLLSTRPMIFLSKISYSVYLIMFLVFFYFSGSSRSGEEFHLSSYIDRLEIVIVVVAATVFTLLIDLPIQNIKQILMEYKSGEGESSNAAAEQKGEEKSEEPETVEDDFESPFADRDEDFRPRPMFKSYEDSETESARNFSSDDYSSKPRRVFSDPEDDVGGQADEEDEEEEEEEEEIPEEKEIIRKPDTQMNARRWRWEMLDD